ncbi:acyltransferase [Pseudomonas sp. GD03860]|uniref:acyltransferase family protein n=1 Tax=Pseudomonas sp. GD03860 TaxID=2975389 RepID=UPI002449605B|nr:acyltransferase [Pseudomonas sp. GD03860]MDH0639102.1 acyltransferase [Pseudomonas sp. GD03860]
MEAKNINSSKLESLTFLRFVAASVVVIFHYGGDTDLKQYLPQILLSGPIMVTFFFVLSGFVISISHYGRDVSVSQFYLNRIARITPVYLLALFLFLLLTERSMHSYGVLLSATFMQAWIPGYALVENSPGWSISVEMFFYAIAPAMILLANVQADRKVAKWFAASILVWVLSQAVLAELNRPPFYVSFPSPAHDLINYFPISHLCSFILGFFGGVAFKEGALQNLRPSLAAMFFMASCVFAGLVFSNRPYIDALFGTTFAYGSGFFSVIFLPVIFFCARADKILSRFLAVPVVVLAGEASYSLYILQMPVEALFKKLGLSSIFDGENLSFALYFVFLFSISVATYLLLEKPLASKIKGLFKRGPLMRGTRSRREEAVE